MAQDKTKITHAKAKAALLRSGYLLESRVADVFRERAFYVQENEIYPDPDTGKDREYDVFAISAQKAGPGERDYIFPIFLIECVNNPQPIAFITKEPQAGFLHRQAVTISGLPITVYSGKERVTLQEYLGMDKFHHYCAGRVSTQYCSFFKKKGTNSQWAASHDEMHFNSLKTLCDVIEHNRRDDQCLAS